jgi:hypothetical protein
MPPVPTGGLDNAGLLPTFCLESSAVGQAAMPFSKHHFDSALMDVMRLAFQKVCDALELKCEVGDPMTEIIVEKIVAWAKAGEHDDKSIAAKVLADLKPRT